jgi:hypothetical protein
MVVRVGKYTGASAEGAPLEEMVPMLLDAVLAVR